MTRGQKRCREENGFSFIFIKFELLVARPWCYVICTWLQVVCKALHVVWWSWFLKLGCTFCWWLTEWLAMMSESGVVYKTNSTGPNTEPCGTPNMTGEEEEAELLTTTHWFLSRRYDRNHWRAVERMPKTVSRWERRIWWSIVSNAAERSSKSKTQILSFCLHP